MLYLVPTPIGNLQDITLRALDILKTSDAILCEDTRHSTKLLKHFDIQKELISFHDHSSPAKVLRVVERLKGGENFAFITDAGMPLISDPGFPLVRESIKQGIEVQALPGASAVVTALAASGLPAESFSFHGFLAPKKAGRRKKLQSLLENSETLIFYESPFRLVKLLEDVRDVLGEREAVVAREITKKFEDFQRGTLSDLIEHYATKKVQGEIVVLVSGFERKKVFKD